MSRIEQKKLYSYTELSKGCKKYLLVEAATDPDRRVDSADTSLALVQNAL